MAIPSHFLAARNKLQEENQSLRDKLYDAEMMIRYLQLKLQEYGDKDVEHLTKNAKKMNKETRRKALQAKVEEALQWEPKGNLKSKTKRKIKRRQQTFVNDVAPGKKTFISPLDAAKLTSDESSSSCSPTMLTCAQVVETPQRNLSGKPNAKDQTKDRAGASMDDPITKNEEHKMVSVIGKLAEVVITEYSKAGERHLILKE